MPVARLVILAWGVLSVGLFIAPPARGASPEEISRDLLHSDLPIFGHGEENEWPQHFVDGDSFGCASRVAFGDWVFTPSDAEDEDAALWYRFANYGVFHCFANISRAYDRKSLAGAEVHHSFFVLLDTKQVKGRNVDLWTIQIGARPGSEYLLLSREPADGIVDKFNVLQTDCPKANVRDADSLDTLLTRYCDIRSSKDLVELAHRMVERPPIGTLALVPDGNEVAPTDDD